MSRRSQEQQQQLITDYPERAWAIIKDLAAPLGRGRIVSHAGTAVSNDGPHSGVGAAGAGAASGAGAVAGVSGLWGRGPVPVARGALAVSRARLRLHLRRAHGDVGGSLARARYHLALARQTLRARADGEPGRHADGGELPDGAQGVHAPAPRGAGHRNPNSSGKRSKQTRATSGHASQNGAAASRPGAGRRSRRRSSASWSATATSRSPSSPTAVRRRCATRRCAG